MFFFRKLISVNCWKRLNDGYCERALSRLSIIKNCLRSTMCDEWMNCTYGPGIKKGRTVIDIA